MVETSTFDVSDKVAARDLLKASGIVVLDCPLSGTGAQAVHKDLTVYASGPKSAIRQLMPVFDSFSKNCFDLGRFGNGMKMKLMANLLVAIHNVSTVEGLLLGQRWGIKPSKAVKVLSDGAGVLPHTTDSRSLDGRQRLEVSHHESGNLAKGHAADRCGT